MPDIPHEKIAEFPYQDISVLDMPWRSIPGNGEQEVPPKYCHPPQGEWVWVCTQMLDIFAAVRTGHGWEVPETLELGAMRTLIGGPPLMWMPLEREIQ